MVNLAKTCHVMVTENWQFEVILRYEGPWPGYFFFVSHQSLIIILCVRTHNLVTHVRYSSVLLLVSVPYSWYYVCYTPRCCTEGIAFRTCNCRMYFVPSGNYLLTTLTPPLLCGAGCRSGPNLDAVSHCLTSSVFNTDTTENSKMQLNQVYYQVDSFCDPTW
jgi:hypothetical protein